MAGNCPTAHYDATCDMSTYWWIKAYGWYQELADTHPTWTGNPTLSVEWPLFFGVNNRGLHWGDDKPYMVWRIICQQIKHLYIALFSSPKKSSLLAAVVPCTFDHVNLHINETTHPPRMWGHNTVGGFYYMYNKSMDLLLIGIYVHVS